MTTEVRARRLVIATNHSQLMNTQSPTETMKTIAFFYCALLHVLVDCSGGTPAGSTGSADYAAFAAACQGMYFVRAGESCFVRMRVSVNYQQVHCIWSNIYCLLKAADACATGVAAQPALGAGRLAIVTRQTVKAAIAAGVGLDFVLNIFVTQKPTRT